MTISFPESDYTNDISKKSYEDKAEKLVITAEKIIDAYGRYPNHNMVIATLLINLLINKYNYVKIYM